MNYAMILYIQGKIMLVLSALLILPLASAVFYKETDTYTAFIIPIIILFAAGILLSCKKPKNSSIYAKEGLTSVALAWIIAAAVGALPFFLSRYIPSYLDSLFETVSGFTTTGASILTNVELLPHSLLFWRSFTHWIGGMGVLVFVLAVLPKTGSSMMHLLRAESPGPLVGKLVSKMRNTAGILYGIYLILTFILILLLLAGGMPLFDSLLNAFGTAGTGGFAIKNNSIAFYDSEYIEIVLGVFMILFGVNFNIYYLLLMKNFRKIYKNDELRWYFVIIALSTIAIAANLMSSIHSFGQSLRLSFFQVSSIITTTGFSTTDFNLWPAFSKGILLVLMIVGASAGSTGGGIKVSRVIVLFKSIWNSIKNMMAPREVHSIRLNEEIIEEKTEKNILIYFAVYWLIAIVSMILISLDYMDGTTIVSSVLSCLNNVGPALGISGPLGNYSSFSVLSKSVLIINMMLGRLEIYPLLVLLIPKRLH